MTLKIFEQEFKGYWREQDNRWLPVYSGVFVVQSYYIDREKRKVSMNDLVYVGKADNIRERVSNHEKRALWRRELKPGEKLCYSCTPVKKKDLERVTAALVHANQPLANTTYKDTFPFDTTKVILLGDFPGLKKEVVVETS